MIKIYYSFIFYKKKSALYNINYTIYTNTKKIIGDILFHVLKY